MKNVWKGSKVNKEINVLKDDSKVLKDDSKENVKKIFISNFFGHKIS